MRGHIKQRGNNWSVVVELPKDPITNKRRQKWYTFKGSKKEAEKFLVEKLREIDTGLIVDTKEMKIKDFLDYWYKEICIHKLSPNTYESYEKNMRIHIIPALGNIKLNKLVPLDLQKFYSKCLEKGLSKTTVLYIHKIIHSALEQAMKWQLVVRNVADNVEAPKKDPYEAKVLTSQQLQQLKEKAITSDIYIPIMIAICTGMRRGEVLGLTWENVDFEEEKIKVRQALYKTKQGLVFLPPKTAKSNRIIIMPHELTILLKDHKLKQEEMRKRLGTAYKNTNLVCCQEDGSEINPDTFTPKFCKFLKNNDLPQIRFHDLRHSHASLLLREHIEPKLISHRLGHSNIGITMDLYSHIYEESNREVANTFNNILVR